MMKKIPDDWQCEHCAEHYTSITGRSADVYPCAWHLSLSAFTVVLHTFSSMFQNVWAYVITLTLMGLRHLISLLEEM